MLNLFYSGYPTLVLGALWNYMLSHNLDFKYPYGPMVKYLKCLLPLSIGSQWIEMKTIA